MAKSNEKEQKGEFLRNVGAIAPVIGAVAVGAEVLS